ncbi:MAG TPA: protein kinase [Candidatus Acidoferrum sp.]|nr:protein kinase [Candidatus Acidoferrum sp.]
MDTTRICAQCHAPLAADATGALCPNCQRTPTGIASLPPPPTGAPFSPPTAAQIAEFFPQLEVYELLGFGGMGMVYKARQLNLDRLVALKILSPELSSQPAFAERFSREAKALARLHHSNIVSVYDFGRAGPYYYFLMEYVDGVDLHTLIQRKELRPPEALRIVVEICQALQFAHDEGIVHRDIKPANILLDKKGRVKMADFGLAKLAGTDGQRLPALTVATGMLGTPQYMAPEQIERPSQVDRRADLYSLGVIFYEMLTGELPLGHFALPSQISHTDARLDKVVLRALEKEPDRRYQQASEILTEVETLSAPATAAVRSRKMAVIYGIGLACALALVAVMGYALFHRGPNNAPPGGPPPPGGFGRFGGPGGPGGPGGARGGFFTNTAEGPSLRPTTVTNLQLTPEQVQVANTILHTVSQDCSQIQSNYTSHYKDTAGHVHLTVKPLSEADVARVKTLREGMWKELGGVFSAAQLERARKLPMNPFESSLFRFNTDLTEETEFWKDSGGGYHVIDVRLIGGEGDTNWLSSTNINIIPRQYWHLLD